MRGSYTLREWEENKWKREFSRFIEALENAQSDGKKIDLTSLDLCPANVIDILGLLGWEEIDFDSNGWEQDTWYEFAHPNHNFKITFFYCGYTFKMDLCRKEDE